jgi:hypothetical protein
MSTYWVHGNATVVESPESLSQIGYFGWGADMYLPGGGESWFHIPLSSPAVVDGAAGMLESVILMFGCDGGHIAQVDVYDGPDRLHSFTALDLDGEHRGAVDKINTFALAAPHAMRFGASLSFWFLADVGFDSQIPDARVSISSAGATYSMERIFDRQIAREVDLVNVVKLEP